MKTKKVRSSVHGLLLVGQALGLTLLYYFFFTLLKIHLLFSFEWFLNIIMNFYLSFNNLFFNYFINDMKIITLVINCS